MLLAFAHAPCRMCQLSEAARVREGLESRVAALQGAVSALEAEGGRARARIKELEGLVESLEGRLERARQNARGAKEALQEAAAMEEAGEQAIRELTARPRKGQG